MEKIFKGPAIFLDRSDINTDEIIPAKYLTEVTKDALKPYMLEDLKLDGFDPKGEALKNARVVVSRQNFGCGSSREHAPWVFEVNDVHTIIAEGYARIFRQNMFNGGMLAIELPKSDIDLLFELAKSGQVTIDVDVDGQKIKACSAGQEKMFNFEISEFDKALVKAGGWVEFADERY
ncbi:3-isopropylmalate dehydratase small subunit 2 [Desulfuromonas acetoxidans]|uniref:Aconitate hydratase-like n=1 Tax=Desulfuromonas acetoxidans (strain DSM 684 / 11070) TaxID=281689 RepID=Q1K342_DESA6|nr:3-isopropylmalate dehydratase small subunit [Desulfuromonas acetoxidans]EAT16689.1 aconitate hydratase-like [Desulfuromonas acetoxidans DSM 684]MBF0644839.1 3-isopropylmalate dehydratase small subunit [Desulfuromonas acetoxidans]NVD23628.1 3-isopropylmalate dehydratase small subunit [Desulfuromonas acetoxidans]NVE15987.1 3-isopropylmalate dehydratase small subunit [Desulfuromonas acetoxidans]